VHFGVLHFGVASTGGRIGPIEGSVEFDVRARSGELRLTIPTARLSTGSAVYDARLAQDDLVASRSHPQAWFVATDFRFDGSTLREVRGEFTWRGVGQPLSLRATRFACRSSPDGREEWCGGDFEASFKRSEFGASFGLPFVADRVSLQVSVLARRALP
jgi:polyisoprenoid-binding protein YceI